MLKMIAKWFLLLLTFTLAHGYYVDYYSGYYNNFYLNGFFQSRCYILTRRGIVLAKCSSAVHGGYCPMTPYCNFCLPHFFTFHLLCYTDLDCRPHSKCCLNNCYQHPVCLSAILPVVTTVATTRHTEATESPIKPTIITKPPTTPESTTTFRTTTTEPPTTTEITTTTEIPTTTVITTTTEIPTTAVITTTTEIPTTAITTTTTAAATTTVTKPIITTESITQTTTDLIIDITTEGSGSGDDDEGDDEVPPE